MDVFLDKFLLVFHTFFALFNLLGWIWKKTRRINLYSLLLTAFSWFILGIWYGIGYCPFTEWHWRIKMRLGNTELPASYIKYLIDTLTGLDVHANTVDVLTGCAFGAALILSVYFNVRDYRQ